MGTWSPRRTRYWNFFLEFPEKTTFFVSKVAERLWSGREIGLRMKGETRRKIHQAWSCSLL